MGEVRKLTAADLFCGAGGFTAGAEASGRVRVALAINHWRTAIFSHQNNHPKTRHICARIENVDVRTDGSIGPLDLILASPECTHHSIARGGRPVCDQKRQQPFALLDWIDSKRPRWVCIENVREFRDWGPLLNAGTTNKPAWRPDPARKGETFRAWVAAIEACGYRVDCQLLNAADFGAPTSRTRLFVLGVREDIRLPTIPWPEPTHAGRWRAAAEVIDWSQPCPSIFGRKRPLAEKTLRRIVAGLRRFVAPFIVALRNNQTAHSAGGPLTTICTSGAHHGLAVPFWLPRQGHFDCRRDKPAKDLRGPLNTITAHHGPGHLVLPYITKYYGTGGCASVAEPLDVVTTKDRFGLAMASLLGTMRELHVADIGFRMLQPHELLAAQGFPAGYSLHGNKADQVKQIGNAVCPPVAEALCSTIGEVA